MLRSLTARLSLTLFLLLLGVGVGLMFLVIHTSTLYEQEVSQKLNKDLAQQIAQSETLIQNRRVNEAALDQLFHQLMIINPSIELYLLDKTGKVLAFSAPEGKVKRSHISLSPVEAFLSSDAKFPLMGDDPRSLDRQKIFSAAPIGSADDLQGYLYIVLGGEQYDNVSQMPGHSVIVDSAMWLLLVALVTVFIAGVLIFFRLTRRLRGLSSAMQKYSLNDITQELPDKNCLKGSSGDEVDLLCRQFYDMAGKINAQINALKSMDNQRREMIANVSHDLRTPLTTMRGYLETLNLKRDQLTEEDQRLYLETAIAHCQTLAGLVEELFELARLDSCENILLSEAFSMSELVQDVVQKYSLRAQQKDIRLEVNLNPDVPLVNGDIAMMQRVLENLLENAFRYTPPGGCIRVRVHNDSGQVNVQISDSGKGIANDEIDKIFDRFYRADNQRHQSESTGLGLAIVKRILELHGSMIHVDSQLSQGSTFSFQLHTTPGASV